MIYPLGVYNPPNNKLPDGIFPMFARTSAGMEWLNVEIQRGDAYVLTGVVKTTAGPQYIRSQLFNSYVSFDSGYLAYAHFLEIPETSSEAYRLCFGEIRHIIHASMQSKSYMAVGDRLIASSTNSNWHYVWDAIKYLPSAVFGEEWWTSQMELPEEKRHIVVHWSERLRAMVSLQSPNEKGVSEIRKDAGIAAFAEFCWDLFVVLDNHIFAESLVKRMKDSAQFQGARYELFAAASCIKAGCSIEYFDESGRIGKTAEFKSTCKETRICFHVEAKSRHRAGVMGYSSGFKENHPKPDFAKLINSAALKKKQGEPLVIFCELNLPPIDENTTLEDTLKRIDALAYKAWNTASPQNKDKFNALIFTNSPNQWLDENEKCCNNSQFGMVSSFPEDPITDSDIISRLSYASSLRGKFPEGFLLESLPRNWAATSSSADRGIFKSNA